jgi:3-methyladenine DNA glycosylase AlkD
MRVYFKRDETVTFFGVALPVIRRLARDVWLVERHAWSVGQAVRFCDTLVRRPEFEAKAVGVLVLTRWHRDFRSGLLRTVRSWLAHGHCASWAAVDLVAPSLITPLVIRYPALRGEVATWVRARSLWVRRAALVTFVPRARYGEDLDTVYRMVLALADDPEDLIHKAAGWLMREAGKADPRRLERFLGRHGWRLPRTTVRYAIERFPAGTRRWLLVATRR